MEHHTGELAYLDTFSGMVPCKVVDITTERAWMSDMERPVVVVKLTATRGAYRRGEVIPMPPEHVVPRSSVRVRSGQYRIRNDYAWVKS